MRIYNSGMTEPNDFDLSIDLQAAADKMNVDRDWLDLVPSASGFPEAMRAAFRRAILAERQLAEVSSAIADRGVYERDCTLPIGARVDNVILDLRESRHDLAELLVVLENQVNKLIGSIRKHRDQRGDDRCWMDDEELYKALPEGYTPPVREVAVELGLCEKFIESRRNPATEYVSPQIEIERLQAEVESYKDVR